jgi:hypothetical protein
MQKFEANANCGGGAVRGKLYFNLASARGS